MNDIKIPPAVFAARARRGNFRRIPLQPMTASDVKRTARDMRRVVFDVNGVFAAIAGALGFGIKGSQKRIIVRRR